MDKLATGALNRQQYLPHLDGLRAIAVVFVIVYHTDLGLLPGGFIGVDIFFVLSGFLITNQLSGAINNGQFRFRDFYLRRIRRLIPAYTAVSLASMVAGYYFLLPKNFVYHAKLTGLAFLSVGNFYIENTSSGYFAPQSAEIPLLHTWSLSVEEQFYLVWPALLLWLLKVARRGNRLLLLGGGFALCLWWSQWQALHEPAVAYYLLPARFCELLVGALLSISMGRLPRLTPGAANGFQVLGLALLFAGAFMFGAGTVFPGLNAMVVCLATALLIYAGSTSSAMASVLATAPMVLVGRLSYSLYLWHWPVFAFWRYSEGELSPTQVLVAVVLSFLLALMSWHAIEKPFRYGWKKPFAPTFGFLYALPFAVIFALFLLIDADDGIPARFGERQAVIEAIESRPAAYNDRCGPASQSGCINVLLIGDSHAEHFGPFLRALSGPVNKVAITSATNGFCPPLLGLVPVEVEDQGLTKKVNEVCLGRNKRLLADVSDYQYVVLAAYWALPQIKPGKVFYAETAAGPFSLQASMQVLRSSLFATVKHITDQGSTPVIILDNPTITKTALKCSYKRARYAQFKEPCVISRAEADLQRSRITPIFAELAAQFPQVRFINPLNLLCDQRTCSALFGKMPVYRDRNHLNAVGSRVLGERWRAVNASPFNPA